MAFTPDGPATPAATPAAARASGPADVGALVAQVLVPALSTAEQYDEAIRLLGYPPLPPPARAACIYYYTGLHKLSVICDSPLLSGSTTSSCIQHAAAC